MPVRNRDYQSGSAHVIIIIVLVLLLIGALGYIFWQTVTAKNADSVQNDKTQQSSKEPASDKKVAVNPYGGWKDAAFTNLPIAYKIPADWSDAAQSNAAMDSEYDIQDNSIASDDGFMLRLSVHKLPRGYEGQSKLVVREFQSIDSEYQWVVPQETDGSIRRIFVSSGVTKAGQEILPFSFQSRGGYVFEFEGYFGANNVDQRSFASLKEFTDQTSVTTAKLVLQSLKFQ